jgi:rubrerythrin
MAKYGSTGNLDDLGSATRHYQAVDKDLHELNRMLGVYGEEEAVEDVTEEAAEVEKEVEEDIKRRGPREKEIIREKEVIIKIRCEYCKRPFDETLDACPSCGARR